MKEDQIKVGSVYAGNGWTTPRKVEAIEKLPGKFTGTDVIYSRVGGGKGNRRKSLLHFAFEATNEVSEPPT